MDNSDNFSLKTIIGSIFRFTPNRATQNMLEDASLEFPDIIHQDISGAWWIGYELASNQSRAKLCETLQEQIKVMIPRRVDPFADQEILAELNQRFNMLPDAIKHHPDLLPISRQMISDSNLPGHFERDLDNNFKK